MSRRIEQFDLSDRDAWPTEHLEQLLDVIDDELRAREAEEPQSLTRGLSEALNEFLASRKAS